MQIGIRTAEAGDYSKIYSLIINELGYEHLDYEKLCIRLDRINEDAKQMTVVAIHDGSVAGFMGINRYTAYNYDGEYLQIVALAVSKDMQSKGIGTCLTSWAEEYAIKYKMPAVVLTSRLDRAEAHAFYEHRGYSKVSYGFRKDFH